MNDSYTDIWSISDTDFKKHFENIYYEHIDSLYRFAYFRITDTEKATDLVQDVFIKYFAYLQKLRQNREVENDTNVDLNHRAFLFQSLRNAIIDQYRLKKSYSLDALIDNEGYDLLSDEDATSSTETDISFKELSKHIVKLKPAHQELIYMRYFEGMSVTEISLALNERENTISVKLHRIAETLKKNMRS
ncbi:MAG: sigma-70 family RNA polymerase sigma factor [Patescibacteria group bacterium]